MKTLTDEERADWLQLIRTDTIGPITFHRLLAKCGSAREALAQLPQAAKRSGRKSPIRIADRETIQEEIDRAKAFGVRHIASCETDYPQRLAAIADPPPLICLKGHASLFARPAIAIVGARNASAAGRRLARELSSALGEAGVVIASGLARGIDGAAHEASLRSGAIAVVAGGLDVIYPPEHESLMAQIGEQGALLTERPMGHQPTARDFPRRNRLISGVSNGVIVVEAAEKSGTLITARFALEQGRDVFAAPGSPLDPRSAGANRLIQQGAILVQSAQDVLEALAAQTRGMGAKEPSNLFEWAEDRPEDESSASPALRAQVRDALSFAPIHRDLILREINAPPGLVLDALLELVLAGDAEEHSGGCFALSVDD